MNTNQEKMKRDCLIKNENPKIVRYVTKHFTSKINKILKSNEDKLYEGFFSKKGFNLKLFIDIFKFLISVYAIFIVVFSTYYNENDNYHLKIKKFIEVSEFWVANLILITLIISFFRSKNKSRFFLKYYNVTDLVIVLSIYFIMFEKNKTLLFRFLQLVRIFRVFKMFQDPKNSLFETNK